MNKKIKNDKKTLSLGGHIPSRESWEKYGFGTVFSTGDSAGTFNESALWPGGNKDIGGWFL